ncbi:hypothetical protein HEP87_58515 [Streptomyces sp. S1D4-11]
MARAPGPRGQTAGKTLAVPLGEPGHHQRLHGLVVVVQVLLRRVGSRDALGQHHAVDLGQTGIGVVVGDDLGEEGRPVVLVVMADEMLAVEVLPEAQERHEELLLAREVVQHALPGQSRPLGDRVDRGPR